MTRSTPGYAYYGHTYSGYTHYGGAHDEEHALLITVLLTTLLLTTVLLTILLLAHMTRSTPGLPKWWRLRKRKRWSVHCRYTVRVGVRALQVYIKLVCRSVGGGQCTAIAKLRVQGARTAGVYM